MALTIYNSLTRNKDPFVPMREDHIGIYVCGPTVYDLSHIGHARVYVAFDTIVRFLRTQVPKVTYVRNYTDVDDKIIARAQRESLNATDVSEHNIKEFQHDMQSLGVLPADVEPKVTEHIDEVVAMCKALIDAGQAYSVSGDVYYAVEKFAEYGKLGRRSLEDMEAGIRVDINSQKRHPMDFVLWKAAKPGEPAWEAPWGRGRPGWHIECSAMSQKYLGDTFDLHGGGRDLIFPHHENEIAQSEAALQKPYARVWMHGGLVNINNEKMSKSLGNFFTIRQVLDKFDAQTLRYYLLTTHYRSPIHFSDAALKEAEARVLYCYRTLLRIEQALGGDKVDPGQADTPKAALNKKKTERQSRTEVLTTTEQRFVAAMQDDFNTPEALGAIAQGLTAANDIMDHPKEPDADKQNLVAVRRDLVFCMNLLGLFGDAPADAIKRIEQKQRDVRNIDAAAIEAELARRNEARASKDFARADAIRKQLAERGVEILDRPNNTSEWRLK